jgi:hypothetical protein
MTAKDKIARRKLSLLELAAHQGRGMNGRTPAVAFRDGLPKPHQPPEDTRAEKKQSKQAA